MDPLLSMIVALIIGVLLGTGFGWLLRSSRITPPDPRPLAAAQARLAAADATSSGLREQLELQAGRIEEFQLRLRELGEAEQQRQGSDGRVLVALSPVAESLRQVQRKVTELEEQRQRQHGELSEQLRQASESEERLRATAETLASALRSNSTRGVWGETQLRSVVEAAGLIERVDFDVQTSIVGASGAGRPDMVVHLPGGKNMAVDAKVPFDAYLEASRIPVTATGADAAERERLMKRHVKAVRDHITTLGSKSYWSGLEASPELVIAFIPSESLVSSAMEADPSIMEFAFSRKVALASPVTLWSVLKTVAFSWQQDVLTHDAKVLFDLSRELYTRLATTATHVEKLGRSIERSVRDYNGFVGSLERQVFPTARKLNALDESTVLGVLPTIKEQRRQLSSFELVAELERDELEKSQGA
ncbi:DNA recombination protein RmuC [Agreia sp. COWG]|uniref:DNA recombination protein RmuC n=1 Tax=Agreia sp. COWG TaxID=2773266 RepID=UPI001926174E|nr:DNA recombination protein RmuC [Agreia sp. COWG]CAD6002002.1 DNA recombination protein RmuC [Agreia sp. COWG]